MPEAPVLIVGTDQTVVETDLAAGRLGCPPCGGVLGAWGHARRRVLRRRTGEELVRPRRTRCRSCRSTHVLLTDSMFLRRRDDAETIGGAVLARAGGSSHRRIAKSLGVSDDIVRGWLRAFGRAAETIRAHFTRWAHALDPLLGPIEATGNPFADAVAAMGAATRAAVQRQGPQPVWAVVSRMTGGALLCHTRFHYPPLP
jgi:transposase-like protein